MNVYTVERCYDYEGCSLDAVTEALFSEATRAPSAECDPCECEEAAEGWHKLGCPRAPVEQTPSSQPAHDAQAAPKGGSTP